MRGHPPRGAGSRGGVVGAPDLERVPPWGPPFPRVCRGTQRGRGPWGSPPRVPRTRKGRPGLDKLDPLLPGGRAHDPPPSRCLCPPRGRPVLHKPARLGCHLVHRAAEGGSEGAQPQTLPFLSFYFFFFPLEERRTECSILPYLCFYSGTNVGCVCVCFLVLVF